MSRRKLLFLELLPANCGPSRAVDSVLGSVTDFVERSKKFPQQFLVVTDMSRDRRQQHQQSEPSPKRGRPRRGVRSGERVRDYPTLTVRVPHDTRALLKALGSHMDLPLWQTIRHLTVCFVRELPLRDRRSVVRDSRAAS